MDQDDATVVLQMISLALTGIKKELETNNTLLHELSNAMVLMNKDIAALKPVEIPF